MPNTLEFWKHTPSTMSAIFAIELPYRPPKNPIAAFIWRRRLWIETTIGLSVLEPWEKIVMIVFIYLLLALTATGFLKYLPEHTSLVRDLSSYLFFGREGHESRSVPWLVAGLVGHGRGMSKDL